MTANGPCKPSRAPRPSRYIIRTGAAFVSWLYRTLNRLAVATASQQPIDVHSTPGLYLFYFNEPLRLHFRKISPNI